MSNQYQKTWETVTAAWSEQDDTKRRELLDASLEDGCSYEAPGSMANSKDELLEQMAGFQKQVPGGKFVVKEYFELTGSSVAAWEMQLTDGTVIATGISHGVYEDNNKLSAMSAFYKA